DIRLSRTTIPTIQQAQLVYVLFEIQPDAGLGTVRLPVNLALVVDRSESMCIPILSQELFEELARRGEVREVVVDGVPVWEFHNVPANLAAKAPRNLDFVKVALRSAVEKLGPQDRFSLVVFAKDARVLVGNEVAANRRRLLAAVDQLERLQLGNETFMARGMGLGYKEAAKALSPEIVSRMVLLTDGFTADGEECLRQAQQATAAGLAISTVGVGVEFNEELLINIADLSKGNAHFIHDPQDIPAVFAQELSGVQAIALRNLELKLRLTGGVELRKAYRAKPTIANLGQGALVGGSTGFPLGDLERDAPQALLLELLVPPRPAGSYRLAEVVLAYDNPAQGRPGQKVRRDVVVQYSGGAAAAPPDSSVMNMVEKVSAHTLQTRALQEAQAGNVAGATVKLQAAYTRLLDMGESDLAEATRQELENLQSQGHVSAAGTKKLRYETRRLAEKDAQ
ncbi:MAG: VWA domain-containing protein, partial [Anaerolineae bacterium]